MSDEGQLGEILELIGASSPDEREQIFAALAKEGDVAGASAFRAADLVNRQIEIVSDLLGITPDESALMLGRGDYSANVDWSALTERIADHIDTNWQALEPNLEKLSLLVGRQGEKVLKKAERLANQARRQRGSVALQIVWELTDSVRAKMINEVRKNGEGIAEFDEQVVIDEVRALAEPILEDYLGGLGKSRDDMILGCLTGRELKILSNCKKYVMNYETQRRSIKDGDQFRQVVWQYYSYCKKHAFLSPLDRQLRIEQNKTKKKLDTLSNIPKVAVDLAKALQSVNAWHGAEADRKGLDGDSRAYPIP